MNCDHAIYPYTNAEQTVIPVSQSFRDRFCNVPSVTVYQAKTGGGFELVTVQVHLSGMPLSEIRIDHGGRASGFIKIK